MSVGETAAFRVAAKTQNRAAWVENTNLNTTLGSISAYEKAEIRRNEDTENGPDVHFSFDQEADIDQWSQEFRLTSNADQRFRWILGVYYFFEESLDTTVVRRTRPQTAASRSFFPVRFSSRTIRNYLSMARPSLMSTIS